MADQAGSVAKHERITEKGEIQDVPDELIHRLESGRYKAAWMNFKRPSVSEVFKFFKEKSKTSIPSKEVLDVELPVESPDFKLLESEEAKRGMSVTWLGHACVLVQMDGIRFLTDPVFSSKCGPSLGFQIGIKRYRDAPCKIKDLRDIDAVVISHNHYDHLDYHSVCELVRCFPDLVWFVPMGVKALMQKFGCKNVEECEWWHWCRFKDVQFTFVPAQHWSKRGPSDNNKTLWGGWCIKGSEKNFYFAGDTGYYNRLFTGIGEKLGPFDLAAIPIGAYSPRSMMQYQHIDPTEALRIHDDVKAKKSIAIHWGTFNLSTEPILEPREKIRDLQNGGDDFFTVNLGETKFI